MPDAPVVAERALAGKQEDVIASPTPPKRAATAPALPSPSKPVGPDADVLRPAGVKVRRATRHRARGRVRIAAAAVLLAVLVLAGGGVWAWWQSRQEPVWYQPPDPTTTVTRQLGKSLENATVSEWTRVRPAEKQVWTLDFREEAVNAWLATRLPQWIRNRTSASASVASEAGANVAGEQSAPADGTTSDLPPAPVFPFTTGIESLASPATIQGSDLSMQEETSKAAESTLRRPGPIAFSVFMHGFGGDPAGDVSVPEAISKSDYGLSGESSDPHDGALEDGLTQGSADDSGSPAVEAPGPLANLGFGEAQVEMVDGAIRFGIRLVSMAPSPVDTPAAAVPTDPAIGVGTEHSTTPEADTNPQVPDDEVDLPTVDSAADGLPASDDASAVAGGGLPDQGSSPAIAAGPGQVVSFVVTPRFDHETGGLGVELSQFAIGRLQLPLESFVRGLARRMMDVTGVAGGASADGSTAAATGAEATDLPTKVPSGGGAEKRPRPDRVDHNTRTITAVLGLLAGQTIDPIFPIDRHREARIIGIDLEPDLLRVQLLTQPRGTGMPSSPPDAAAPAVLTERPDPSLEG